MPDDWIALFDQAQAAFKDVAKMQKGYFDGLVEAGFTEEQALDLTKAFLKEIFHKPSDD